MFLQENTVKVDLSSNIHALLELLENEESLCLLFIVGGEVLVEGIERSRLSNPFVIAKVILVLEFILYTFSCLANSIHNACERINNNTKHSLDPPSKKPFHPLFLGPLIRLGH